MKWEFCSMASPNFPLHPDPSVNTSLTPGKSLFGATPQGTGDPTLSMSKAAQHHRGREVKTKPKKTSKPCYGQPIKWQEVEYPTPNWHRVTCAPRGGNHSSCWPCSPALSCWAPSQHLLLDWETRTASRGSVPPAALSRQR